MHIYTDEDLHLCTFKTPIKSAFMSDTIGAFGKGNCYHALEKCEGVNRHTLCACSCHLSVTLPFNLNGRCSILIIQRCKMIKL